MLIISNLPTVSAFRKSVFVVPVFVLVVVVGIIAGTDTARAQTFAKKALPAEGDVQLMARPANCVALHRGQVCFQRILFSWKVSDVRQYCLYKTDVDTPVLCAEGSQTGIAHEYSSKSSETFVLKAGSENLPVATLTIDTAWVYRTGRRSSSSWRLF